MANQKDARYYRPVKDGTHMRRKLPQGFMNNKRKIAVFALTALAVIGAYFFGAQNSGLVVLPDGQETPLEKENAQDVPSETIVQKNSAGQNTVVPSLSFEVIKPTELKVVLIEGMPKTCPQESTIKIDVENAGKSDAERLFAEFQNFKVSECENCNAIKIGKGKKIEVAIEGCKEKGLSASVQFYAINAEKEIVEIK